MACDRNQSPVGHKVPATFQFREFAEAGGLLTFVACRQYKDPQGARIPVPTALLVRADEVTE